MDVRLAAAGLRVGVVMACAIALAPPRVLAEAAPPKVATATAPPAEQAALDGPRVAAPEAPAPPPAAPPPGEAELRRGEARYERGDYSDALSDLQAARALRDDPALDFAIARCLDRLDRRREAIAVYRRFASAAPPGDDADEAARRIAALIDREERLLELGRPAPQNRVLKKWRRSDAQALAPPSPQPGPDPGWITRRWWFWTAAGGGLGLIAGAVGLGVGLAPHQTPIPPTALGSATLGFH